MFYQVPLNFHRQVLSPKFSRLSASPRRFDSHQAEETSTPARINRIVHLGWEVEVELSLKDGRKPI